LHLIELKQVRIGYHKRALLPPIDLKLSPGTFLGIVGPNGSGKTTLVRTLLGLLPPVAGQLVYPAGPGGKPPRFGYVPQRASVDVTFPLTAYEVVLMGRYGLIGLGRRPRATDHERTRAALADVEAADLAGRPFHALSGGQRQRVLVARALAAEPEILVLDEAATGMDLLAERAMLELAASFTARRIAVVMISHQLGAVVDYAVELALVPGGDRPVEIGRRAEILSSERLSRIYGRPIAVRSVDGHAVIFVEHECHTGEVEKLPAQDGEPH
jgi:manganese/iron transport system ATP-binding protein